MSKLSNLPGTCNQAPRRSDDMLTAAEIAAELHCSKALVYKLLNGEVAGITALPHLSLGRKKVVPRPQFELWKQHNLRGKISPNSEMNAVDAVHREVDHA